MGAKKKAKVVQPKTNGEDMNYDLRLAVMKALHNMASNAATSEGPEGCREYAECYSLHMRTAHESFSEYKDLQWDIRQGVIETADDAGMSEDEAFEYWEDL